MSLETNTAEFAQPSGNIARVLTAAGISALSFIGVGRFAEAPTAATGMDGISVAASGNHQAERVLGAPVVVNAPQDGGPLFPCPPGFHDYLGPDGVTWNCASDVASPPTPPVTEATTAPTAAPTTAAPANTSSGNTQVTQTTVKHNTGTTAAPTTEATLPPVNNDQDPFAADNAYEVDDNSAGIGEPGIPILQQAAAALGIDWNALTADQQNSLTVIAISTDPESFNDRLQPFVPVTVPSETVAAEPTTIPETDPATTAAPVTAAATTAAATSSTAKPADSSSSSTSDPTSTVQATATSDTKAVAVIDADSNSSSGDSDSMIPEILATTAATVAVGGFALWFARRSRRTGRPLRPHHA